MSCTTNPQYIIVPNSGSGTPGPAGPAGPQGPPGSISLPLPADDVSVTNLGFSTLQEALDYLLYVPLALSGLSPTISTYETGSSVNSMGFTWNSNRTNFTSLVLTGGGESDALATTAVAHTLVFGTPITSTTNVTLTAIDTSITPNNVQVLSTNINFYWGVYWGSEEIPVSLNSAFLNNILSKRLQSGKSHSFTSNATDSLTYVWYAYKKSLGVASFTVGGFAGGFEPPITLSHTNEEGATADYYVYRSTNSFIGTEVVQIT